MEQMSIIKLLLVTLPENICSIYIAFLLSGDRIKLPFRDNGFDRRKNIAKLLTTVILLSIVQYIGRYISSSMDTYFLLNIVSSTLIIGCVYNKYNSINHDKKILSKFVNFLNIWKKPFVQVLLIFFILYFIEIVYLPPVLQLLSIPSMKELYKIPWANIVFPQIDRFFQFLIISALWNYQRINLNLLNLKCKKPLIVILYTYIILLELGFSYLYITGFSLLNMQFKIICFILLLCIIAFNIFISKIVLNMIDRIYEVARKE